MQHSSAGWQQTATAELGMKFKLAAWFTEISLQALFSFLMHENWTREIL